MRRFLFLKVKNPVQLLLCVVGASWFCLGGLPAALSAGGEDGFREWESADGRSLEARILSVDSGKVRMERVDGREFVIPVDRFAPAARDRILAWTPPPIETIPPDEAVLSLQSGEARGSGFLAAEGGRVWVYTNQHVIGDPVALRAFDTSGREIRLGELQIAADRDLARFATETRRGLEFATGGSTGQAVAVYGNSRGSGVITRSEGEIIGVAPTVIEVSSEIVSGNSGGPVLDSEDRVLGVSSYVTIGEKSGDGASGEGPGGDPTIAGTRFEKPRRFALRIGDDVRFSAIGREEFQAAFETFSGAVMSFDEAMRLVGSILGDPLSGVLAGGFESAPVGDVAEDHNDNLERVRRTIQSPIPYHSKLRKVSKWVLDSLEDAAEVGEDALETARDRLSDERLGWMLSELDRREDLLERWREAIARFEKSFD